MAQDDVQKRLDHSLYGTPQIKPEEQKKYLGAFRERCYLTMTIQQMRVERNQKNLLHELALHPEATIRLNGSMDATLQTTYIQLFSSQNRPFTIVTAQTANQPQDLGLVLTANEAVNVEKVDIEERYPQIVDNSEVPIEKKSFWKKFFS